MGWCCFLFGNLRNLSAGVRLLRPTASGLFTALSLFMPNYEKRPHEYDYLNAGDIGRRIRDALQDKFLRGALLHPLPVRPVPRTEYP